MRKIILILSLFICNFAFSQTWVIPYYPNKGDTMFSYVDTSYHVRGDSVPKRRYRFKELEDADTIKHFASKQSINIGTGITIGKTIDGVYNEYERGNDRCITFNSLYAGDTLIALPNPSILNAIQIEKGNIKVHLSEVGNDSITIISIDESKKVTRIKYKLLKF